MQFLIVSLALAAVVSADVSHLVNKGGPDADAVILKQDADVAPESYQYSYETSNGIAANEAGQVQNAGREDAAVEAQGQFSYTGTDGVLYRVEYVANANGFQPQGAHLPTPQPIPEYIQRSLAYIAAHPQAEEQVRSGVSASASASAFARRN